VATRPRTRQTDADIAASGSVVFIRAANVGGNSVFSPAALAKKLDLVNIGAAGTFVARRRIAAKTIAAELPFVTAIVVVPAADIVALVDAGPPPTPASAIVFVSVLTNAVKNKPKLPIEFPPGDKWALRILEQRGRFVISMRRVDTQRGLDLNAIIERAFGVPFTTRTWGTMARIRAALA
jgi:hypothetical protein